MSGDNILTLTLAALGILVVTVALFVVFREGVLWYFRIGEQVKLLRDIRDALRRNASSSTSSAWVDDPRLPAHTNGTEVRRRPGEPLDQFNSRVADALEQEMRPR